MILKQEEKIFVEFQPHKQGDNQIETSKEYRMPNLYKRGTAFVIQS